MALPDFVIIGAMKCGTTTLQEQLAAQPSFFMSTPKEPNFFSDDRIFARGMAWYEGLFANAPPGALKGEASTHYTKLPTHPHALDRLAAALPHARLIYLIRDPLARLVSHYIHGRTMREIRCGLPEALERHPELIDYGRYAMQIAPWLERFGHDRIHVTSLESLSADPQGELARVGTFLGATEPLRWREDIREANVSATRLTRLPFHDLLIANPAADALRRTLVPRRLREAVKARLRISERPALTPQQRARLAPVFAEDAAAFAALFPEAPPIGQPR